MKPFLKHPLTQQALSVVLAGYIRLVFATSRITRVIDPRAEPFLRGDENAIFAFWHGRMMLMPVFSAPRELHVLISHHGDGRLISRVITHFCQHTITGSTSRGGLQALRIMARRLKDGDNIGITPDGPRGPNQTASIGVATLAQLSQKPIIPVTFSASRYKRLRSWDRFMLALPFGRIVFCVGHPIMVQQADEAARRAIEAAMNQLVEQADALQ